MRYVSLFLLSILTSCTITGDSKLNVQIIDKKTRKPVTGAPVTAKYLTKFPAPMAFPRVIKRTSDANGSVTFDKLADGSWDVYVLMEGGELQDTSFHIREGQLERGNILKRTKDGGSEGSVYGNPDATTTTPVSPVVFYGKLVR
ncbi:hypothetical protein DES53_102612 [Roseimicrobium gellanilyticum]|uniref:Uncharacterized protein n=2 Tax=Roseimicrobium gellanilyticum TaxID=748857 RepID=A0A366HRV2_9BACT|nr:hypothetical protein DES53_102612 [Roseimicrobium gellanilyticum]